MSDNAVPTLDAPELTFSDYRALREGRSIAGAVVEDKQQSEGSPAPPAESESGAGSEPAEENVEGKQRSDDGKEATQDEKRTGQKKGLVDEVIKLRRENRELKTRGAPPPPEQQTKPAQAPPVEPAPPVTPPADDPEPDQTKYTDYDKYNRDVVRWEVRQAQRQAAADSQRAERENAARARVSTWQGRVSAAAADASLPDFEAIAFNSTLPISQTMGDAIMGSELGPKLLYHLGSNPDEAARISKLHPIDQAREIGKLELKLTPAEKPPASEEGEEEPPPKQTVSKAPPPIRPPAGSGTRTVPTMKNLEGISQAEYRQLRESGKLR